MAITPSSRAVTLAFAILLTTAVTARSQERSTPQELYRTALLALERGDFEAAFGGFSTYAEKYPASPVHSTAVLGAAKAALRAGRLEDARSYCDRYLKDYGRRSGRALAYLYRGQVAVADFDLKAALDDWSEGYRATGDASVQSALRVVTERLAASVDPEDASELFTLDLPPGLAAGAWQLVGERYEAAGQRYRANRYFAAIADRYADTPVGVVARNRQREIERLLARTIRIGLLAPLTGNYTEYGKQLQRGVELAAMAFADSTGREVDLMVEDTHGNAVTATKACQSLLARDPVSLIGPLTSASAIGCAAAAAAQEVPLIVPAATETGLASLGDEVYCLSPAVTTYGATLGRYAVEDLELCSHLIIAPNDALGYDIAAAYRDAVEAAGGTIWHETYYEPGSTDYGPYLRAFKSSFLDTLSDTTWFYAPDSTRYDDEEITVYPDAVFTPGSAEDLMLLLPQIRFYKIAGQLIGTDSFADDELQLRAGGNLEDAIFASVHPLAEGILSWELFRTRYAQKYGTAPDRLAAVGYDAFRFLTAALGTDTPTPQSVGRRLERIDDFEGATGRMRFGPDGDNTRVPIYYIRDRRIAPAVR